MAKKPKAKAVARKAQPKTVKPRKTSRQAKKTASSIPKGFHTLTAYLVVADAKKAITFYKKAFSAVVKEVHHMPDGRLMHAALKIGDSMIMLNDEFPEYGVFSPLKTGTTAVTIHMYVKNADRVFQRAVSAGATVQMPLMDALGGDRYGQVTDPSGHKWSIATHKEDLTPKQMEKRAKEFFEQAGPQ